MLCENKEDRDKCAADGIFQKFDPTITFFVSSVITFGSQKSRGLQAPLPRGYAPDHTPTKATPQKYTHTSTFDMSHFKFLFLSRSDFIRSYPADLCFIIFHRFEFVSIKDLHSDLEHKSFIGLTKGIHD